ncbi:MAG: hypothetical protein NDI60_01180 [Elusimicrobiales bacterium]|nr:hypothetical protein [Elusimicrobiales bacterium]
MKHFLLFAAVSLLAACAVPQGGPGMKRGFLESAGGAPTSQFVDEVIEVITVPPGAQVNVNETPAGVSPLKVSVRRYWRGKAGYLILDMVKIEALPVAAGQCMRSAVLGQNNLRAPATVTLDMASCADSYEHGYNSLNPPVPAAGK